MWAATHRNRMCGFAVPDGSGSEPLRADERDARHLGESCGEKGLTARDGRLRCQSVQSHDQHEDAVGEASDSLACEVCTLIGGTN